MPIYTYNSANELTSTSQGNYAYDANGNTLTDPSGKSYSWDFENRLTQAVAPGTGTTTFRYDPFGRRIQKSGPLGPTNYLYDGLHIVEQLDSGGNVEARFSHGEIMDEVLATLEGSAVSYYEADGLNSVTSLSTSSGATANTYTYDSFGKLTSSTGSPTNPFQYTGRESDQETGLLYYRSRYYSADMGRFVGEDRLRWGAGLNWYTYVSNEPVLLGDPMGQKAKRRKPPLPYPDPQYSCLVCTVYAEARGTPSACQTAVASVILNRVAAGRAKGRRTTICGVVSAKGQFDGYGNDNYKACMTCSVSAKDRPDFNNTVRDLSSAFDMTDATSFGTNNEKMENYFENTLGMSPVDVPNCPNLIFFTGSEGNQ